MSIPVVEWQRQNLTLEVFKFSATENSCINECGIILVSRE